MHICGEKIASELKKSAENCACLKYAKQMATPNVVFGVDGA